MAGAHPHYRSVHSTSPVILTHRQPGSSGSSGNAEQDLAVCRAAMRKQRRDPYQGAGPRH
jgi:hypothetical protein